mgnify:CR=1 FL=1
MLVLRVRKSDTRNQKSQTLHPFYHFHHLSDVLSLVEIVMLDLMLYHLMLPGRMKRNMDRVSAEFQHWKYV